MFSAVMVVWSLNLYQNSRFFKVNYDYALCIRKNVNSRVQIVFFEGGVDKVKRKKH